MDAKLFLTVAIMAVATLTSAVEAVDYLEYPVDEALYIPGSYEGRTFYGDGIHLGEDIKLSEKTPIKSIGNGDLIVYKQDNSYPHGFGELYAIILHDLGREYEFRNALGQTVKTRYIKSIYGHIRNYTDRSDKEGTKLKWVLNPTEVQPVKRGEIIGYVNNDAENGDGKEHLHAGIALNKDVGAPFGYDNGTQGKNFAAMSEVIKSVKSASPTPYTFTSHAYTGNGDVQGGKSTDYNYSLPTRKTQFAIGETVEAMIRVENISIRHRWFVEIWRGDEKIKEYIWNWGEVEPWVWKTSYFWPVWSFNREGNYQFRVYLYIGDDSRKDSITTLKFSVVKPADWQPYTYDGNGYTGYGPQTGNESTGWRFSLPQKTAVFNQGDLVYGMVYVNNLSVDHRWLAHFYRNGTYSHTQYWSKASVGQWIYQYSYFWPQLWGASLGEWEARVFLETEGKENPICTLKFSVVRPANQPAYSYDNNGYTGYGPQQGGEKSTDWKFSLPRPAEVFNPGDHVYGMIYIKNVYVNHRFHVAAYRDNALAYNYDWPWNNLDGGRWDFAYFWPELGSAEPGNWKFEIYLEYDGKVDFIDTLYFTVNNRNNPAPPPPAPGKTAIRFDFNGRNAPGWTTGYDTTYTAQDQVDDNTWMVIARGSNPGVVSPELPSGFSTAKTPLLHFSVKIRGLIRRTYGQVWLMDNNGAWGYETVFEPVKVDYNYYEYTVDLSGLGNVPIRRFSIELTQDSPYEQWIFDWVELK